MGFGWQTPAIDQDSSIKNAGNRVFAQDTSYRYL